MRYCAKCIMVDTRPDIHFDENGVCSACNDHEERKRINWAEREKTLEQILNLDADIPYHAVVPVSGGKDSHYQVLKLQEFGARVLAVNSATDMLTPLGRRNLDNLKNYCDVIEVTPNIRVRKALVRIGLFQVGDMSWPEHIGIWSIPTRIAVQMGIPLVVWGEQPQSHYGRPEGVPPAINLDERWVSEFGGLLGLRLDDVVGMEGLSERDLDVFRFPDMSSSTTKGIWLGDYLPWDGWKNALYAQHYGFEVQGNLVEGSSAGYENLDNYVTVLRDHLRWLKYGYTRSTDILCNHIRNGRISRVEAFTMQGAAWVGFPETSLGKPVREILEYFGITVEEFSEECEKWGGV